MEGATRTYGGYAMATRKSVKAQVAEEKSAHCAYIGPSVRGLIQTGTIYNTDKTTALLRSDVGRAVKRYPMVKDLIVPGNTLATARKSIKNPGTLLHHRYEQMISAIKEDTK